MNCYRCDSEMNADHSMAIWHCPKDASHDISHEEIMKMSCQRCGEGPDPDLRSLWMACLYAMEETGLPFERFAVHGKPHRIAGWTESRLVTEGIPEWAPVPDCEEYMYKFYLLRVCKGCRAEWMGAIREWFHSARSENMDSSGNIVFRMVQA
jgi:hypothetical protein